MSEEQRLKKCSAKGCASQGVPQTGFDFFVCDHHLAELERLLSQVAVRRITERN